MAITAVSQTSLQAILYLVITVPFLAGLFLLYATSKRPSRRFTSAAECRCILDGSQAPDTRKNRLSRYEARAIPNQEMKRVFGIENAFTTEDGWGAEILVDKVQRRLSDAKVDWVGLASMLSNSLWEIVKDFETLDGLEVQLTTTVQALVLGASLRTLFDMRDSIKAGYLVDLSFGIHRTLLEMGSQDGAAAVDFSKNEELQNALEDVFMAHDFDVDVLNPRANPLSSILHFFEMVSPIVLRLFMELYCRDGEDRIFRSILRAFAQKPTSTQFGLELGDNDISAEHIVKEALRLYPPTGQIKRSFQFDSDAAKQVTLIADIEACHLDPMVWGADVLKFKPERWKKVSVVQNLSFLAFGSRPFLCPASHDFGLRVVGLLTGILLDVFGEGWKMKSLAQGDTKVQSEGGQRLNNKRGAYDDGYLEPEESENAWVDIDVAA